LLETDIPFGYLRVTEILQPFSKLHLLDAKIVANAADRGTRVHKFCTLYALNMLIIDVDDDCKGYVDSYKRWHDSMVAKVFMASKRINNACYRISGEFDLVVQLKDSEKSVLIDLKTPASSSPSWQLQTAAYKMLIELDDASWEIDRRIALQLPKDGSQAKVIEYTNHENDEEKYLKALELYRFFYG
jgi:hypothetical protein